MLSLLALLLPLISAAAPACDVAIEDVLADPALARAAGPELVARQLCLARAAGSPDSCAALARVPGTTESSEHSCRRFYLMMRLSEGLASRSTSTAACEAWCRAAPARPAADVIDVVCRAFVRADPDGACEEIARFKKSRGLPPDREECGFEARSLLGKVSEDECRRRHPPGRELCLATRRLKNPALCAISPLCRAMRGEASSVCAGLEDAVLARVRPAACHK